MASRTSKASAGEELGHKLTVRSSANADSNCQAPSRSGEGGSRVSERPNSRSTRPIGWLRHPTFRRSSPTLGVTGGRRPRER